MEGLGGWVGGFLGVGWHCFVVMLSRFTVLFGVLCAVVLVGCGQAGESPVSSVVGEPAPELPAVSDTPPADVSSPPPETVSEVVVTEPDCDQVFLDGVNQRKRELARRLQDYGFDTTVVEPDGPCEDVEVLTNLPDSPESGSEGPEGEGQGDGQLGTEEDGVPASDVEGGNSVGAQVGGELSLEEYERIVEEWSSEFVGSDIEETLDQIVEHLESCEPVSPEGELSCPEQAVWLVQVQPVSGPVDSEDYYTITDPEALEALRAEAGEWP